MDYLFPVLFAGWGIGMVIYIKSSRSKKYNKLIFYNVSDKVIKYKKIKDNTSITKNR